jgi:two-component system chemotaxis response regulator CheB
MEFDDRDQPMTGACRIATAFDVVVMAASVGGLKAFSHILADLPADFPIPIVLAQHVARDQPSLLAEILDRRTHLRVKQAEDGEALCPATVYTPVPNRHLRVRAGGTLGLDSGPRVQFARPAADVLFRSAADAFGERALAVVLTGGGCDGSAGVLAVRGRGGFVIAQDETTSEAFAMPYSAALTRKVDLILPLDQIAFALATLAVGEPLGAE